MRPWRITSASSDRVNLEFTPWHVRTDRVNLAVLANDPHQAFGVWAGSIIDEDGRTVRIDGIRGWAEEVVNRW
jgi:hypothetical protein